MASLTESSEDRLEIAWFNRRFIATVTDGVVSVKLIEDKTRLGRPSQAVFSEDPQSLVDAFQRNLDWLAERGITPST